MPSPPLGPFSLWISQIWKLLSNAVSKQSTPDQIQMFVGGWWWGRQSGWVGLTCRESSACLRASWYRIWTRDLTGVTVLGPVCARDWPRAALCRASSEFSGSRPVQLVGPQGPGSAKVWPPPPPLPLHHSSPLGYPQWAASGERWSNRKQSCFLTCFFSLRFLSGTERLQGRCLCFRVASVRDLLFSSQRLSNQYLISPPFSLCNEAPQRKKAHRLHRTRFHDSHHWRRESRRGEVRKTRGKRKWPRGGGDTAGADSIKTPEEGGDLWVIAFVSSAHSRPIYRHPAQPHWSHCLKGKKGWCLEALISSS